MPLDYHTKIGKNIKLVKESFFSEITKKKLSVFVSMVIRRLEKKYGIYIILNDADGGSVNKWI